MVNTDMKFLFLCGVISVAAPMTSFPESPTANLNNPVTVGKTTNGQAGDKHASAYFTPDNKDHTINGQPAGLGKIMLSRGEEARAASLHGEIIWVAGEWEGRLNAAEVEFTTAWEAAREAAARAKSKSKKVQSEKISAGIYSGTLAKHEWKGWIPHGWGLLKDIDGGQYEGMWDKGRRHGPGQLTDDKGTVVRGNWNQDAVDEVFMRWNDGTVFVGKTRRLPSPSRSHLSNGIIREPTGSLYKGSFDKGVPQGHGIMVDASTTIYSGEWRSGVPEGHGTMMTKTDIFEGAWSAGKKNGVGKRLTAEGMETRGRWANGSLAVEFREEFKGELTDGKPHGTGTMFYANGDRYEGEFERGEITGRGRFILANEEVITGTFKQGGLHGPATIAKPDGSERHTVYNFGQLVWADDMYDDTFNYPVDSDFDGEITPQETADFSTIRQVWLAKKEAMYDGEYQKLAQTRERADERRSQLEENRAQDEARRQEAEAARQKQEAFQRKLTSIQQAIANPGAAGSSLGASGAASSGGPYYDIQVNLQGSGWSIVRGLPAAEKDQYLAHGRAITVQEKENRNKVIKGPYSGPATPAIQKISEPP